MFYKSTIYILSICFICFIARVEAQEVDSLDRSTAGTIDSAMAISPDYMPVRYAAFHPVNFMPLHYRDLDISFFQTAEYGPLLRSRHIYQSLGINGQAHQSMIFDYNHEMGFSMISLPYPLYFKQQRDLYLYDVQTSYTKLAYTYGIPAEHNFQATHAQRTGRFDLVFNLSGNRNAGYFVHQEVGTLNLDVLVHYQTKRDIYGFTVSYLLNHLKLSENGGLSDCERFSRRSRRDSIVVKDLGTFNVVFSDAATLINTHDVSIQQYVNFRNRKDRYFGTVTHTFQYKNLKSLFTDHDLNNDFYQGNYYISSDSTCDSLHCHSIANALQWSNYTPMTQETDKNYDFRIACGIQHEYVRGRMPFYDGNSLSVFARTNIRLFKICDLSGSFSYSFRNYIKNDIIIRGTAAFAINRTKRHFTGVSTDFYRVAPDYFYTYYIGNHNVWYLNLLKQNNLKISAFWAFKDYRVSLNYFMLKNHVMIDETFMPWQYDRFINLIQLNVFVPLRVRNFSMDANLSLQHADTSFISVPLFAGKLSAAYDIRMFKKKLGVQIGADLWYNTAYHADGYNPLLHQFYHQEEIKVGNYLYFNLNLTINIKRVSFFFRAGNLLSGYIGYNYFTTPYYPMRGRNFALGITWRFYD